MSIYVTSTTEHTYNIQTLLAYLLCFFKAKKPNILLCSLNNQSNNATGELNIILRNEKVDVLFDQTNGEATISSFDIEPTQNNESLDYYVDQTTGDLIYDEN